MITEFINEILEQKAKYEILEDWEWFYAEIPWFTWVWAQASDLENCRKELKEILEEWLILKLRKKQYLPTTINYDLNKVLCEN